MDDERSDDAMSGADEALRVLRAELSVAASPDLEARVRARIAEPRETTPPWRWLVPAVAAAGLLIAAILWMRAPGSDRMRSAAVESPAPPPNVARQEPAPTPSAEPVPAPRRTAASRLAARRAVEPVRPLVPPGEEARIARYAASVRRWPYPAATLPESDPQALLADAAPIEILEIETAPLVPDEGSHR